MKNLLRVGLAVGLVEIASTTGVWAQSGGHEGHEGHGSPPAPASPSPPAPPAPEPQMPLQPNLVPQPGWPSPVMDQHVFDMVLFELLEARPIATGVATEWDAVGWYGTDYNRLWLKSEGLWNFGSGLGTEAEFQALYGRLVSPYYDFQIGLRFDHVTGPTAPASRWLGVIGFQGLSPYNFEVEPALFVSQGGQLSARLTASRDLLLTQRTALQGRMETNVALQAAEAFGVGAGLNDLELGLRLRHQIVREFAPYVGVSWNNRFGETAQLALRHGEAPSHLSWVIGLQGWY